MVIDDKSDLTCVQHHIWSKEPRSIFKDDNLFAFISNVL